MPTIDLRADLKAEDDEGRWWSLLRDAADPAMLVPGAMLIAGTHRFWSVVRIEQVDGEFYATDGICTHEAQRPVRTGCVVGRCSSWPHR